MKKATVLLCFLSILMIAAGALAAPGDAIMFTETQRREMGITDYYGRLSIAGISGTLYMMCGDSIYLWQAGQEEPKSLISGLEMNRYSNYASAQKQLGEKADTLISLLLSEEISCMA